MQSIRKSLLICITACTIFMGSSNYAQNYEITPYVGYQLAGGLNTIDGRLSMKNGINYGLVFDFTVEKDMQAEIWYSRLESELSYKSNEETTYNFFDNISVEYFHAGALYVPEWGKIRPIGIITLGFTRFHLMNKEAEDDWRFSVAVGGGAKFFLTGNIALRVQARVLVPIYSSNTTIYCTNGRCLFSIEAGTVIWQADLNAGLTIAF